MAIVKKISELTPKGSNLANTDLLIVGVDNGTDYDLKSVTGAQLLGNVANGLVPYTGATTNVNLGEFEVKAGQVSLDTTPTGTATVTTTRWNDSLGISETTLKGGSVVLKNGVDLVARVVNKVTPTTTLTKANYQVVRISGAQGQRLAVNLAQANNDNNSADTLGVVCETIATNAEGFIMTMGQLENINTTGSLQSETWVDGDVLYLSPTTAGKITNIKPTGATGHIVILGYVEYSHAVNGKIYVKIMNGWELDELHNVSISDPLDKQVLSYENSTSLWKNKSVTTADIADSTNKRYVTDANLTVIGNTSGTNTGDQDLSGYQPLLSGGITNRLTKWSSSSVISNSLIQDNGTTLSIGTTPVANNLFKLSSNATEATILTENSQASGVGILGSSSGSNGIGASFTATSSTGIKVGVNGSATGSGGTNKGGVFGATGGVNNYSIQLTDGTQGAGKFLKSVTANGEANWANIANTDVSGLGTLATQSGTFSDKQDLLVSGTNIKTINGTSILGSGDLTVGSSSGICGIANASGVYTYYATLSLAMTAATSGQTIELFADIIETGSVAITLKSGVKINGNGHTYTLSVNDNTSALICNSGTVELFNWKVVRTGRSNGAGGYVLNCFGGILKANGIIMQNTYGDCVIDGVAIYGLNAIAYLNGFSVVNENTKHYECIGESTGTGNGMLSTYSVGCTGIAVSGSGITGNGTHLNSIGISTSGSGLSGQTFTGCIGLSTSGTGVSASSEGRNCIGISTSGVGGVGIFYESTMISSSNYGVGGAGASKIYNSYVQSTSAVATSNSSIYGSTIRCLWNNAGGNCTATFAAGSQEILNSFLEVTNASSYCITGFIGSTWKYSNNSFKGATTAVNTTNITQGITNTHDNQGNILI